MLNDIIELITAIETHAKLVEHRILSNNAWIIDASTPKQGIRTFSIKEVKELDKLIHSFLFEVKETVMFSNMASLYQMGYRTRIVNRLEKIVHITCAKGTIVLK